MAKRFGVAGAVHELTVVPPSPAQMSDLLRRGVPPQNLDAEKTVLGSVLRNDECMNDLVKLLQVDSFYSANHQKIYQAMVDMFSQAQPIDALTLGEELSRRKQLKEIGGAPYLADVMQTTMTAGNVLYYGRIVQEKAILRHIITTGTEILRDAYEENAPGEELLGNAEKKIFALLENRALRDAVKLELVLKDVFNRITVRQQGGGDVFGGVPSGFDDIDELTNGWQNSELIILAARPAIGKTSLALNMAEHAAVDKKMPVLLVSLEMSQMELAERMLCSRAKVNSHHLRRGRTSSADMSKLIEASGELGNSPIFIDDTPGQTMLRIAATARRLKLRQALRLVIVDYLQLIEPDDRKASRVEQIGAISRRLKTLARELNIPIIALSQLNRAVETREGHRPRMADLRESGSIEQDADVVVMLHRDDAFDPECETKGQADVIIAKQRNGPVGDVKLAFAKDLTRFRNFAADLSPFSAGDDGGF